MGEAILGEVTASQMGGAHGGGPTGYISCRECTSCIAKCARSAPGEMMGAKTVTCKAAPADTEAAPSDTESPTTRVQTSEMRATEVHASQAHAAQMHATEAHTAQMNAAQPAKAHTAEAAPAQMNAAKASTPEMHAAEAATAKMHAATTEVAATTKSSEPSRLHVRGDAKGQCRR